MGKILIIEDDTDINNMMAEALRKAGYTCTQAFSGTEGLLYIERETFSLVVLDLMLPGLNGEELLPQIKEKQNIPVMVPGQRAEFVGKSRSWSCRQRTALTARWNSLPPARRII